MRAMAYQITGVSIVCSAKYSGTDHQKHQSSASPFLDYIIQDVLEWILFSVALALEW